MRPIFGRLACAFCAPVVATLMAMAPSLPLHAAEAADAGRREERKVSQGMDSGNAQDRAGRVLKATENCPWTLFTEGNDDLGIRMTSTEACIDMLGGDDRVVLSDGRKGMKARIWTGWGADQVVASDEDDEIEDMDGEDLLLYGGGGDDVFRFRMSALGTRPKGRRSGPLIVPGPGENAVISGDNFPLEDFPRSPLLARVDMSHGARLEADLECGRFSFGFEGEDMRFFRFDRNSMLTGMSSGCDVSANIAAGETDFSQKGGNLVLFLGSPEQEGKHPVVKWKATGGRSLVVKSEESSAQIDLTWRGTLGADIGLDLAQDGGGDVDVVSMTDVNAEISGEGRPHLRLRAGREANVTLDSGDLSGVVLDVGAPQVTISWIYARGSRPPRIIAQGDETAIETIELRRVDVFDGPIERVKYLRQAEQDGGRKPILSWKEAGDRARSMDAPKWIERKIDARTNFLRFDIDARQDPCLEVSLHDLDGKMPRIRMTCEHPELRVARAEGYDLLRIPDGDGEALEIPINGEGEGFRIDEISVIRASGR